ncbi:protein cappuccino isoform X2 [Teleopsis dalmanni]|nr:protein cappuccino isoform X2 [Teleopsis dalmanni]
MVEKTPPSTAAIISGGAKRLLCCVPEKLNFNASEKFEGHLLLKWFISSVPLSTDVKISEQDLNAITMHYCNNLVGIGVLKQVPEKSDLEVFNLMSTYQWTHTESPRETFALSSTPSENGVLKLPVITPNGKTVPLTIQTETLPAEAKNSFIRLPRYIANVPNSEDEREELHDLSDFSITENRGTCELSELLESNNNAVFENGQNKTWLKPNMVDQAAQTDSNVIKTETLCIKCKSVNQNYKIMINQYVQVSVEELQNDKDTVDDDVKKQTSVDSPFTPPVPPPLLLNSNGELIITPVPPPPPSFSSSSTSGIIEPPLPPPPPIPIANITPAPPPPPAAALNLVCDKKRDTHEVPSINTSPDNLPKPLPSAVEGGWFKENVSRKNVLNPPKPMRPLWWTRIVTSPPPLPAPSRDAPDEGIEMENSSLNESTNKMISKQIWQLIDDMNLDNLDEFTELFSRQAVISAVKPKEKKEVRVKTIKVLSSKRSQSIGILARSLHCDVEEIEQGVCNIDTSLVSLETLQQIISIQGTEEELEIINEAAKGDVPLDYPEMFLLNISKICMFSERVSCLVFQQEFDEATTQISRKLEVVERVSQFLMQNKELKHVFSIILTLGNYMNAGNRQRGQADGFALEILGKLKDVKSNESQTTLLHFIVRTYIQRCIKDGLNIRDIPLPVPEPSDVERAAQVNFDEVNQQIKDLQERIRGCKITAELVEQTSNERTQEPFRSKMREFIEHATVSINNLHTKWKDCQKLFIDTMRYYYFTPKTKALKDCTPDQFYECWTNFCNDFKDIWKKEIATTLTEVMNKLKQIQNQVRKNVKTTNTKPGGLKERMMRLTKK